MDATPQRGERGRIVTVFAAKGGCGKTTLATNLAAVLHSGGARRVCLVDLDLAFGDVATMLAVAPTRSLVGAVGRQGRLSRAAVSLLVTRIASRFDCVLAPTTPGKASTITPELVGELLAVLATTYDYVVVDTPAQFSGHVLAALDASDHHVLLTTPERPALQNLRLTLDMLDLLPYRQQSRSVVLNRCDSEVGLSVVDVENVVRSSVAGELPSSRDVPASINRGVPLAGSDPDHPFSQAVHAFAQRHLVSEHPAEMEGLGWGL